MNDALIVLITIMVVIILTQQWRLAKIDRCLDAQHQINRKLVDYITGGTL